MNSLLIIDDDVTLLTRLGVQLEEAGYKVDKSSDLSHGAQRFAEARPDLVILDVRSGHDAGWELLERLAAEVPVMVVSSAAREEDVVRALEAGATDHIAKPYRSSELLARLRVRLGTPVAALTPSIAMNASVVGATPATIDTATTSSEPAEAPSPPKRRSEAPETLVDAKVFMTEAEELAMLRTRQLKATPATKPPPDLGGNGGVGNQMRAERMRRHMTLVQVENDLKIRMAYLQAIEDEKYTLLPRGPAALQMIKRYAEHLDVDASSMLEELRTQGFGDVIAPLPALGGHPLPRSLPRSLVITTAVLLALVVGLGAIMFFDPEFFAQLPTFFATLWEQLQQFGS
ncbi:response regulator [Candidatus Viridilinea mediisalina]|uniref:Response regulatory domain-containing protein n=1 Tax=Candidatus Viridilinea mediisalina TaxID=2024553 RepID=A0A2A6RMI4_9CHLR|nr:response regulator [Candidatus Viridilinea mediisalina]PDW04272.1 hypothetical protein CJ255_04270 [Candidatus Viridilinea mediisalina]